jgi:hypothetical protein
MNELMLLRIAELLAEAGGAPDAPVTAGGGAFRFAVDAILDGVVDGVEKGGRRRINEGRSAKRAETMVTALTQSGCCHDSFPIATVDVYTGFRLAAHQKRLRPTIDKSNAPPTP